MSGFLHYMRPRSAVSWLALAGPAAAAVVAASEGNGFAVAGWTVALLWAVFVNADGVFIDDLQADNRRLLDHSGEVLAHSAEVADHNAELLHLLRLSGRAS